MSDISCASQKGRRKEKCLLLISCSLSRAIHLEVLSNQTIQEFIYALKRLITRKGRPKLIYSDNTKTYVAASKLIEKINKNKLMQEYLIKEEIQ